MNRMNLSSILGTGALALAALLAAPAATAQQSGYTFVPLTPCRVIDTRGAIGTNGGPALTAGLARQFKFRGNCGVNDSAKAVAVSMVSITPSTDGFFALWPSGLPYPGHSNLNFVANQPPIANFAIIGLSATALDMSIVYGTAAPGTAHIAVDVLGYYQ